MGNNVMDEEITIEPEFIEAAKAEMLKNPKLQPCRLCMHYDPEKHWCERFGQQKMPYNYGSNCFLTNEVALRALLLQERKRSIQRKAVLQKKMDIMEALINGADMVREDVWDMVEKDYKRLDIKAQQDDETYRKCKRNLQRLQKAYAEMKACCHRMELAYRNYCEYWHQFMFADEFGCYDKEYDKYKSNSGFLTYCTFILDDAMYESEENVETFISMLNSLPRKRKSPMEQEHLKRYLIKV